MSQIFHLLYTSQSTSEISVPLMQTILKAARTHNEPDGITGFLVARDGYFLQLLEGDEDKVRACLKRIERDPRHAGLVVHGEVRSPQRLMPAWSMAHVEWEKGMGSSESLVEIFELGRAGQVYNRIESLLAVLKKFSKQAKSVA